MKKNCHYVTILCTVIMVCKGTSSSYRLVDYRALILLGLAIYLPSASVSLFFMMLYIYIKNFCLHPSLSFSELSLVGSALDVVD